MTHILAVEDDPAIRTSLVRSLTERGLAVSTEATGLAGLQAIVAQRPDLVLLDLGLPDIDGHTVLSMLRAVDATPVIVITARDDDPTVIRVLDAGADDYVVKPFTMDQLMARIRAVLRRAQGDEPERLIIGELEIHPASRTARLREQPLDLSRLEFDLLLMLARHAGDVVTKRDILNEVWHQAYGGGERTVDVHLSWLRRKLGESAADPVYLHSVRGVGVRLSAPEPDADPGS